MYYCFFLFVVFVDDVVAVAVTIAFLISVVVVASVTDTILKEVKKKWKKVEE